jgi:Flp pilus assembly protein TadD
MLQRICLALLIAILPGPARRAEARRQPERAGPTTKIEIHYPEDGSVFPPEITPPTFLWSDPSDASAWSIQIEFGDGAPAVRVQTSGERPPPGEIDSRAIASINEPPAPSAARSWTPPAPLWAEIKKRSQERLARVSIAGFRKKGKDALSQGVATLKTSKDPVGAPIFYRDVPLMPSELEKGIIKPLDQAAVPLIAWKLRNIAEPRSRLLLDGIHSCANCHSFSADGKTLAMDLDGPQNDKGLYAIVPIQRKAIIRTEDLISWTSFLEQPAGPMRVGFMSQISPDGRYVLTTIGAEKDLARNYFVANFKDYRFLQVFYATRGILTYYDRTTKQRRPLPGADDPRFVQTNGVWSPDGSYIVFARAKAHDAYPEGQKMAEYANDSNEAQVQYDLYRIPFNGGKGGTAERIEGASGNGMSNSFPRVSPDGRWLVFVQARNGLLMRPDSQLYIVPAEGGAARRMRCNTRLMNSWHSWAPNGRWLVFSSKARSPYTQMYLTHIDEEGNDSPPVLIDNATAANRAVNIPEFVNIAPDAPFELEMPAADFYARFDRAWELAEKGRYKDAIAEWQTALAMNSEDAGAHNNIGFALAREGRLDEAIVHWRKALALNDEYVEVHRNLGAALLDSGAAAEAIPHLRKFTEAAPQDARAAYSLGLALLRAGRPGEAIAPFEAALKLNPNDAQVHNDLCVALLSARKFEEAAAHARRATEIDPAFAQGYYNLGNALYLQKNLAEAAAQWRKGLALAIEQRNTTLAEALKSRLTLVPR